MPQFSPVFPILSPLPPLHPDFNMLEASEWFCAQDYNELQNSSLLQSYDLDEVCVQLLLALVSCIRRHQQHKRIFALRSPILRWVSPLLFIGIFARHCCGHRNFQLSPSGLNSSSFGSIKNILLDCLALSTFGFSIAHLWCAFCFAASDINFHISGHTLSGLEVVCFLAILHPDQVYPSGVLSFNKINLVKPVHASDNSFSPSTFQ